MKFRHIIAPINKSGTKERSVQEIEKDEILIGRGPSCDLLLVGRLISLKHARLAVWRDSLIIEDLESLNGVFVNGSLAKRERLKPGDSVRIGGVSFDVIKEDEVWGFLEKQAEKEDKEDADSRIKRQEQRLLISSHLPSFTTLSSALCLLLLVFYFVGPIFGMNRRSWDSGPISNSHKIIEADCVQCHALPFKPVQDQQCLACHKLSEHAEKHPLVFQNHPELSLRCAECHMEHNGDAALITADSKLCTDCHGMLGQIFPESERLEIASFASHPEFRVSVRDDTGSDQAKRVIRVSLDNKEELKDNTNIKLNHKIHLKPGIIGEKGPVDLSCMDCHRLSKNFRDIEPIRFERDCKSCHSLEFDGRLPGRTVPHAEPDVVFNYLYAEYAKLFLDIEGKEPTDARDVRRRKPGKKVERGEKIEFARSSVEKESRTVEESLFVRTACHLCHMITEKTASTEDVTGRKMSRFEVRPSQIPTDWMPASTFDHGAHQELTCESCHSGVRESTKTADLQLPGIDNCRQCHGQDESPGMVRSECVSCHSYHDPLVMKEERKRAIERILLSSR